MATSLAAQLSQIAANSTNSLNLKAQKTAHSQSLLFEPRDAATQDFDTLYQLCLEGFQELCLLDPRFIVFSRSIFSEQSKSEDRTQMTKAQNEELDRVIEDFLGLVGGRLLLKPAVKSVEWLVRRFRAHEYNTSFMILTFLPYHSAPIFPTLLSILPSNISPTFKFLHPYINARANPARHAIVYTTTNNTAFCIALNTYVLQVSRARHQHHALLSFWASIMTEALAGMLDLARSGRKGVQRQAEQDVIIRMLPVLNEGLAASKAPELQLGCYMLVTVLATKSALEDKVLAGLMEAVVGGWTKDTSEAGLVCLAVLAQESRAAKLPKSVVKEVLKVSSLDEHLLAISRRYRVDKLAFGLSLGVLRRLTKPKSYEGLVLVEKMLEARVLGDLQTSIVIKSIFLAAQQIDLQSEDYATISGHIADLLNRLSNSKAVGPNMRRALKDSSIDLDLLEMKLQTVLRPVDDADEQPAIDDAGDVQMLEDNSDADQRHFDAALAKVPSRTVDEVSFLSHSKSHIFDSLLQAFLLAGSDIGRMDAFASLPLLRKDLALHEPLFISFFIKIWCGPYPVISRSAALQITNQTLAVADNKATTDLQAVIPYALAALADPADRVRRAAAELVNTLCSSFESGEQDGKKRKFSKVWGFDDIYGQGEETKQVKWLSAEDVGRFLKDVLLPGLEECILDRTQVFRLLETALGVPSQSKHTVSKIGVNELKASTRNAFMSFLGSHIMNSPLFMLKLQLLKMTHDVAKVGTSSRTKMLLPVLNQWATMVSSDAAAACNAEQIDLGDMEEQMAAIISASDRDGLSLLQSIVRGNVGSQRPTLVKALLGHLRSMWVSLKPEAMSNVADFLLTSALDVQDAPSEDSQLTQSEVSDTLRSLQLPTHVLASFLSQLPTAADVQERSSSKRRRTSHNGMVTTGGAENGGAADAIRNITFVLELIDNSEPRSHPQLLKALFATLGELQHFMAQTHSELPYLQNLILTALIEIVDYFKEDGAKIEPSAVRVDLLVDCIRTTTAPQVQSAALLLVANLARVAPEVVLHSVMPIFTFMGATVLRQDDEYSAHVIDQTIQKVIPPLINSLRKENEDAVSGSSELLLSFVAAFEHIPAHRRTRLFRSLVELLGADDFLFAILCMLGDKYASDPKIYEFAGELAGHFGPTTQLITGRKCLGLIVDMMQPDRNLSNILLGLREKGEQQIEDTVENNLRLLSHLLSQQRLVLRVGRVLRANETKATELRNVFSQLLEETLGLIDGLRAHEKLHSSAGDVLEHLLGLLSTPEFIKSIGDLLKRPDDMLRRKILRSFEVRLRNEKRADQSSREAVLGFLPQLDSIVQESGDIALRRTATTCIDQISERYGKTNPSAIASSAGVIAGPHCLGSSDTQLQRMALLCLASMVEVLDSRIIAILPQALPSALRHLEASLEREEGEPVHDAAYLFLNSLFERVPFMVTGGYLDTIFKLSHKSAESDLTQEADEHREEVLRFAAKQLDPKECLAALERNWTNAATAGPLALQEHIMVLRTTVESHSKAVIVKNTKLLSNVFFHAFDLRRLHTIESFAEALDDEDLEDAEAAVYDVAIKAILKLNDTTFRPLYLSMIEWASNGLPKKDHGGRALRLTSVYGFFATFFGSLKSLVTSYAGYLIENAADVLNSTLAKDPNSRALWLRVLHTLLPAFEHDQDEFWQAPAHFNAISVPLLAQLGNASVLPVTTEVIPVISELAAAIDSGDHHKVMNSAILKHMRSDDAQVRLAAVKCEADLTEKLGEDWLTLLPEMLPFISELQEDDDEVVERETHRWIVKIEGILGESLDAMLQ
ncbi:hypothetical protein L228DRAFT_244950 [Xylona heveae TC161]|uniref:U3 small nucleolar RNA-associated protein 10 n=1 Tax=Xylona heveae (strain CBS 132557 / TC161) TaxID=1328760 RepID=A0A161TPF8_XYLHT|nr:hypothetical protein L228DRAFT_244950 [Xylona heveae TC161]KZF24076.1 hypothetical protein L228DRAFT_244950 [Xylona heveae TC161]